MSATWVHQSELDAIPRPGDRVRFDGKATSWLARQATKDNRYLLCTASLFGVTVYTILDFEEAIRGPMNVIGWGLGIETLSGPDEDIDDAIARLEGRGPWAERVGQWTVSHRNRVPLDYAVWKGSE